MSRDDTYWAAEKDPEILGEECWTRTRSHFDGFRTSNFWARAIRNWLYYYNLNYGNRSGWSWSAVEQLSDGDVLAVGFNEFRAIVGDIFTLVTKNRPGFEVRGTNPSDQSLQDARYGEEVLENYLRNGLESCYARSVLHGLIFNAGYLFTPWNEHGGEFQTDIDGVELDDNGEVIGLTSERVGIQGDFDFQNPTILDIAYDPGVREWDRNRWLLVRSYENRWELAAQAESKKSRDELLDYSETSSDSVEDQVFRYAIRGIENTSSDSDIVSVWNFYHLPTDALPGGRQFRMLPTGIPLGEPQDYDSYRLPVFRTTPGEVVLSQLGYSPANDLQGPQELYNNEMSSIATNHHGCAHNVIWAPEDAEFDQSLMNDGVIVIRGGAQRPVGIDFNADSPGRERYLKRLVSSMESISGMNSAHRGQPEASLKSGEALKVMDAKAVESASTLGVSYDRTIEDSGTYILRTLRERMAPDEERSFVTKAEGKRYETRSFTREHLESIDGITVDRGNPLSQTTSGRLAIAQDLMQLGQVTMEQYLTLLDTGNLEEVFASKNAQIDLIRDENEKLRRGEIIPAPDNYGDHHVMHIREHMSLINSVEARQNRDLVANVTAHVMIHYQALQDPLVAWSQSINGYEVPAPPPMMGPAPGGEGGEIPMEPGESQPAVPLPGEQASPMPPAEASL